MRLAVLALVLAPTAAAQFQEGDLLVSIWQGAEDLAHLTAAGDEVRTWNTTSADPAQGGAVLLDGRVATGRRGSTAGLSLFEHDGSETTLSEDLWIGDLDRLPDGNLILTSQYGHLRVYSPGLELVDTFGQDVLTEPFGLHVDRQGRIWVGDPVERAVFVFPTQADDVYWTLPLQYPPGDLVVADDGSLWTVSLKNDRVRQHDPVTGVVLSWFHSNLAPVGSGIEFAQDGTLLVSTYTSPTIERYTTAGVHLETIGVPAAEGGGVLFLDRYEAPVIGQSYCGPANLNSSGVAAALHAVGQTSAAANNVELRASALPTNQWGMFLNSQAQGFVLPPGSQGNLCLGGAIGRYAQDVSSTGAAGELCLVLDLTSTPTPTGPVAVQPGETWHWQLWFRDDNPHATSNFTDGVVITFD